MRRRGLTNCDLHLLHCQTPCTTSILNSYIMPYKGFTNRQLHNAFWYELFPPRACCQISVWHRDITCRHMCDNLSYYMPVMVISACIHSLLGEGERRGWLEADGPSWLAGAQHTPKILIEIMTLATHSLRCSRDPGADGSAHNLQGREEPNCAVINSRTRDRSILCY